MADNFLYVQTQPTTLAGSGAVSGATSITLTSFYQIDGTTALTMADFGAIGYGTLEPGNGTQEEQISFTGVTANANGTFTLSGIKTVLTVAPYTETSGLARSHPGASKFVISNTAGFYNRLTSKNDDETIAGTWTFTEPNVPRLDATHTYGAGEELYFATYGVVASTSYAGTVNASTTAKGIVEEAYQSEVDTGAAAGGTGARLFFPPSKLRSRLMSDYVADTGTATAYAIAPSPVITQYLAGAIFTFKASHTNNGAATLAVNGLATKDIQKNANGSQGAVLTYGDIKTNALVGVQYDGTQFQLLTPPTTNVTLDATGALPAVSAANLTNFTFSSWTFGGDGSDGALDTSGAPVAINLGGARFVVKNYTTINVATNNLTFTNPHANGTVIVLKATGNVTISSTINTQSAGAAGGAGGTGGATNGTDGTPASNFATYTSDGTVINGVKGVNNGAGGVGGKKGGSTYFTPMNASLQPGSGGGGGGSGTNAASAGGAGGDGAGALYIECGGALNFTGTITASGKDGGAGTYGGTQNGGGGGGGGGGASVLILWNTLTAKSGTISITGGTGGDGGSGNGTNSGGSGGGGAGTPISAGGAGGAASTGDAVAGSAASVGGAGGAKGGGATAQGGGGGGGASGWYTIAPYISPATT